MSMSMCNSSPATRRSSGEGPRCLRQPRQFLSGVRKWWFMNWWFSH